MNKPLINKTYPLTLILTLGLTTVFNASAETGLVVMEAPVAQLQNLQDYDSDGVIKARDQCADTVLGATVDNYGCGTRFSTTEPFKVDIKFAQNSFVIPSSAYAEIRELAAFIDKNLELYVRVEGHTSQVGSSELNQLLSENRAKAVVSTLINDFGISLQRLDAIGYGFERLAKAGDTDEAHAANRRIIVELSQTSESDLLDWKIDTNN